jgi:hypothetical protein
MRRIDRNVSLVCGLTLRARLHGASRVVLKVWITGLVIIMSRFEWSDQGW